MKIKLGSLFSQLTIFMWVALSLLPFSSALAQAPAQRMVVDVTEGHRRPMPIAIADFAGPNGANIAQVVREDLERSGLFTVQNPQSFAGRIPDVNVTPRFTDWRAISTEALVIGRGSQTEERLRVEFRLWDIYGQSQLLGLEFSSSDVNWRRIAHKVADAIYGRLTGKTGMFDSRVIFVSETGPRTNRIKRLAVMDQDGANPSFLTDGDEQILNPRFSTSGQQVVYTSLGQRGLKLWVLDIPTGRREAVTGLGNMVFAPRFSRDGQSLIFSSDRDGNTDIMTKNLRTGQVRRLTDNPAIDTSPDFSPDSSRVVFTSDRSGNPQIYKMNAQGTGVARISFGSGRYSTPVWSPDGTMVAFTKQAGGQFHIGVMNSDGSNERILASSYLVEGPSFAPNGRVIVFQREEGPGASPSIWTVDVSGANLRKVSIGVSGSDPAWSPMLE
ncbi:MAG: TolB protein [Hyphomonadaceae bacterium]|nr:MAG: TolB protein [Hyphomonadaceae bacterium]KAF0186901.1 MAG: TolB protein [Hyphomonadaceae bacterium]